MLGDNRVEEDGPETGVQMGLTLAGVPIDTNGVNAALDVLHEE